MIQFRPKIEGALFYSPGRDLAYAGSFLINYGIDYLHFWMKCKFPAFKEYLELHQITEEELEHAIQLFLQSLVEEVQSNQYEPLDTNVFSAVRFPVQLLIYGAICPLFIGEMLKGIKDVSSAQQISELDVSVFYNKSKPFIESYMLCPKWLLFFAGAVGRCCQKLWNYLRKVPFIGK